MANLDMPHETRTEIIDLLQSLARSWPHCTTIFHADDAKGHGGLGKIERYIRALQWLTDRGMMSFEAMIVDMRGLSIMDSALTPRGREYSRTHITAEISDRPES